MLIAIVALGLVLRVWSARGGLWVDEAWSAVLVDRARTPLGIFFAINHDNNHHLNSLWMQFCGFGASPFLLRALSITTGTLTILVAAAIGARQSVLHALLAALLFAISPILVNYGSEARGYAPMLLAAMVMIWRVDRVLASPAGSVRQARWILAVLAVTGLLSHLTMLFFIVAIAVWIAWTLSRRTSAGAALGATIHLLLPTFVASLLVAVLIFGAAAVSPTGMQVGDYVPFTLANWFGAILMAAGTTLGLSAGGSWVAVGLVASIVVLVVRAGNRRTLMAPFCLFAILVFPLLFPLLQIANSGMTRYYLLTAIAILLLVTDVLAAALAERRTKVVATIILAMLTVACLQEDIAQAAFRRGDTGAAITAMKQRSPAGATVMVEHLRPVATLRVAAASAQYPLTIVSGCPAQRFLHVDLAPRVAAAPTTVRCGRRYGLLVVRRAALLSGVDWALYEEDGRPAYREDTHTTTRPAPAFQE